MLDRNNIDANQRSDIIKHRTNCEVILCSGSVNLDKHKNSNIFKFMYIIRLK